jgi:hypothetical protein
VAAVCEAVVVEATFFETGWKAGAGEAVGVLPIARCIAAVRDAPSLATGVEAVIVDGAGVAEMVDAVVVVGAVTPALRNCPIFVAVLLEGEAAAIAAFVPFG